MAAVEHRWSPVAAIVSLALLVVASTVAAFPAAALPPSSLPQAAGVVGPCSVALTDGPGPGESLQGRAAIAALGSKVPTVAELNGLSSTRLLETLRTDSTAKLDQCARLFYQEHRPTRPPLTATPTRAVGTPGAGQRSEVAATSAASSDSFSLNSRPGSKRTIYLDFDGYPLTGTSWNQTFALADGYALAPFTQDGTAGSFSVSELDAIKEIWARVSEAYAPFDVNVTTQDPGAAAIDRTDGNDDVYGTAVAFTSDEPLAIGCQCGGIAYINVFGQAPNHGFYQPAIVFGYWDGADTKNSADTAAHESGHNFGLAHDGADDGTTRAEYYAGQGAWGPFMGGAFTKPLQQWSAGEYSHATNTQDDLAVIARGAPHVADDHGDDAATASPLDATAAVAGLIGSSGEADWFAFTSTGTPTALLVETQSRGSTLDAELAVFDSNGSLVGNSNPAVPTVPASRLFTPGLGATLSWATLPAGTYYARVRGVGQGDPLVDGYSDYASLGRYTISVSGAGFPPLTVAAATQPRGVVGRQYASSLSSLGGDGGEVSWAVTGGVLPPGLALSTAGVISGIPTTAGTFRVTVTATNSRSQLSGSAAMDIRVVDGLALGASPLIDGTLGATYTQPLLATGGDGGYRWALGAGVLPAGLRLDSDGTIRGTAAAAGSATFDVVVTESGGLTARRTFTIGVFRKPVITAPVLNRATVGAAFSARFSATGGKGPLSWRSLGPLPPGLGLSRDGIVNGTPKAAGSFAFWVVASDGFGRTSVLAVGMRVARPLTAVAQVSPTAVRGRRFAMVLAATGGSGPYSWRILSGSPPRGLALTSRGVLSGVPTRVGTFAFTVQVRDGAGRTAVRIVVVRVR